MSSWFDWYIERFLLVHLPTSSEPLSSCLHLNANLIVITRQVRNPEFDLSIGCHIFPRQVPCRKDKKKVKIMILSSYVSSFCFSISLFFCRRIAYYEISLNKVKRF
jgi:hypothetical protein